MNAYISTYCLVRSSEHLSVALLPLRFPFLKEKASDELKYAQDVIEFISHLGKLIKSSFIAWSLLLYDCSYLHKKSSTILMSLFTGCLMRVPEAEVRQQIIETVKSFYNHVAPNQLHDGTDSATRTKPRTLCSNRFSRLSLSETLSWLLCWHACSFVFLSYFISSFLSFHSFFTFIHLNVSTVFWYFSWLVSEYIVCNI